MQDLQANIKREKKPQPEAETTPDPLFFVVESTPEPLESLRTIG